MARVLNLRLDILGLISISLFLIVATPSKADLSKQEKHEAATALAAEINRAISRHQTPMDLRDRVMHRVSECNFVHNLASRNASDLDTRRRSADVHDISLEVLILLFSGINMDRYKAIVDSSGDSVVQIFKRQDEKQLRLLLRNCRSLNDMKEIEDAVQELTF